MWPFCTKVSFRCPSPLPPQTDSVVCLMIAPNQFPNTREQTTYDVTILGSPFSKPSVFVARSHSSPYGSVVATTTSAFSSVVSPATTHRAASPSAIGTTSLSIPSATKTELERRPSNSVGPSSLYPWIKSETKDSSNERRDRADGDSEKTRYHMKSEIHRKSPSRQVKNFSIQALAGDRSETLRPRHAGTLDSSGSHIPREPRPTETRSFLDKPLLSLNTLDKRPVDYRTSTGSIDLNRNTLYPRFDPMMTVHSPHVNSLTPSVGLGYVYPGAPFLADSMYHSSLGQGMFLGSQDSMTSLGRTQDLSFYNET